MGCGISVRGSNGRASAIVSAFVSALVLGGKGTRAAAAAGAATAAAAAARGSNVSKGRLERIGARVAKASTMRCNCATATPSPKMTRPPVAAVVPATIRVFPMPNSLLGMPKVIIAAPAATARPLMKYNKIGMGASILRYAIG
jgi:hypothetical protein